MRALVLAPFSWHALEALRELMPLDYENWTQTRKLYDPEELGQRMKKEGTTILVVEADFIFEEVFQQAKDLQFLGVCRNSLTHVDLDAATRHNILVVNTPWRNARAVAELAIALVLSLARRVPYLDNFVKDGYWQDPVEAYISYGGIELQGNTLGLIGLGGIGRIVSKLGRALGMEVLAYDPYVGRLGQRMAGSTLVTLDEVLEESRFLSLHAPLSDDTIGLIGDRELGMMRKGAYLINTGFHGLVDEPALINHLNSGHLGGAALDVHDAHPIPPSSPLLKLGNVILTPHIGGATVETIDRHSKMILQDIQGYLRGVKPRHLANPKAWTDRGH